MRHRGTGRRPLIDRAHPAAADAVAPRVDVHVHLGGLGTNGSGISVSHRFRRGLVFRALLRSLGVTRAQLGEADRLYVEGVARLVRESSTIDRAVVLAMDGRWRDGRLDRERSPLVVPNDWARDACRQHPELLYGASVNPERPNALDELDRVAEDGAVLVKWLPNVMGFDLGSPAHVPFFRRLAALRMPVLTHCGAEFTLPGGDGRLGCPTRLERALDEGVVVIVAHCATLAWARVGEERLGGPALLGRLAERYPSLHADVSALASPLRGWWLRQVLDTPALADRLVGGSDFPVPAWAFTQVGRAPLRRLLEARREPNFFDREGAIKRAAGLADDVARRAWPLLRRTSVT